MSDERMQFDTTVPIYLIGMTQFDTPEAKLLCPMCRYDYVHVHDSFTVSGNDGYKSGSGLRGDSVVIQCWSECGSAWELWLCFHKGRTFAQMKLIRGCLDIANEDKFADLKIRDLPWTKNQMG